MKILGRSIIALLVVLGLFFCYDYAQWQIMDSCEHASFFFYNKQEYECLPYTKGMLEHEMQPHVKQELPPR
jgi:hypothetical protein